MQRWLLKAALPLVIAVVGCDGRTGSHSGGESGAPTLQLVDSVVLAESDTAFLGRVPHTYTVDPAGRMYVVDRTGDRLLVFAANGALLNVLGKHGGGPGEFQRIGALTIPHQDLLLQGARGNRLSVFRGPDLTEVNRLSHTGYIATWAINPRWLLLGLYNPADSAAVVAVSWDSIREAATGARLRPTIGALPALFKTYPGLELFNGVIVGQRSDTLLLGFGPTDYLVRIPLFGGAPDTVQVPRRERRPINRAVLAKFTNPSLSFHDGLTAMPDLSAIWTMGDGHVVLWFQEGSTENANKRDAEIIGHAQIAVLSPDFRRACVDARIDAPGTQRTRLAFARDTIYSLDQVITDVEAERPSVTTVVRRYAIGLDRCEWLPTTNRPSL